MKHKEKLAKALAIIKYFKGSSMTHYSKKELFVSEENTERNVLKAVVNTMLERPKEALLEFERIDISQYKSSELYVQKSICYFQLRNHDKAIQCLDEGLSVFPKDKNLLKEKS